MSRHSLAPVMRILRVSSRVDWDLQNISDSWMDCGISLRWI